MLYNKREWKRHRDNEDRDIDNYLQSLFPYHVTSWNELLQLIALDGDRDNEDRDNKDRDNEDRDNERQ